MASTLTLKSAAYDGRYMQLTCTQTKNAQTNTSTISWTLSTIGGSSNYYSTGPTEVFINGIQVYYEYRTDWETKRFPASKGSVSGTVSVSHGTDGTKSIQVSMSTVIYHSATKVTTYSSNWELDPIVTGATILTYPENTNDTTLPTVTYANPRGNNVDSLSIGISDSTGMNMVVPYRAINKTGTLSYTFTRNDVVSLLNATAGSKFYSFQFRIRTVIGGVEYISAKSAMFTVTENADTKPTVSMALSIVNPSSIPIVLSGTYIQGKSRVKATITATGKYGASVSGYNLSVGGVIVGGASSTSSSNVITSDAITASGEVEVIGSAIDTRTFKGTASKKITVIAYSKPLVVPLGSENAILCYRSDGNGIRVGNSTSVWIKAKRSYYDIAGGNKCKLQWRRKLSTDAWDSSHLWTDLIPSTNTTTNEFSGLISGVEFVLSESYTVQIRAIDDFGESDVKDFDVPTQDVALHLGSGGKNVSIGEYCDYTEEYTFRSAWKAIFDNGVHANHIAGIDLYNGKDFNDLYNATGYYVGESPPNAVGCLNYPSNNTGMLEVISAMFINETTGKPWGFAYQTYRDYTGAIYTRSYYSSVGWMAWKTIT